MTKLIVAFRNFAKALKKKAKSSGLQICQQLWNVTLPTVVLCAGSVPKCKHCVTCFGRPVSKSIKHVNVVTFNFTAPDPSTGDVKSERVSWNLILQSFNNLTPWNGVSVFDDVLWASQQIPRFVHNLRGHQCVHNSLLIHEVSRLHTTTHHSR
jgi:hypothetical protein